MNVLKRFIYLGYYIKKMNWPLLFKFYRYTVSRTKRTYLEIILDNIYSVFRYNISILEYFQFNFHDLADQERAEWAGTGFMYETMLKLNPKKNRYILSDKIVFLKHYQKFVNHYSASIDKLEQEGDKIIDLNNKVVLKSSDGQCGKGVEVIENLPYNIENLIVRMKKTGNDLLEEYIVQHIELSNLSPSGLNTLRIVTTLNDENEVDILGARLRISVNSHVDNLAAGNIAAPVDIKTGVVNGPGVYSDITKKAEKTHPITGSQIEGFKIPFFNEAVNMVLDAALHDQSNRSIGWDVAISNTGPSILEGNHDWCKLVWQLPVGKGLKKELEKYVS